MNGEFNLSEKLTEQVLFYGLLGKILIAYPQKDFYQSLLSDQLFEDVPFSSQHADFTKGFELLNKWQNENGLTLSDESFDRLLVDNTRLFVGVNKVLAPPWESVYFNKDRMVFQEETIKVRNWYQKYNLQSEQIFHEPDDHIGLELNFVAHLARLALEALENQDEIELSRLLGDQHSFLVEHPLRWSQVWCDLVNEHARTDFYCGIALLVNGALKETDSMLRQIIAKLPGGVEPA